MQTIEVNKCEKCPFFVWDTDYDCVGDPHYVTCNLATILNFPENVLYIGSKNNPKITIPKWCPLKDSSLTIVLNERREK